MSQENQRFGAGGKPYEGPPQPVKPAVDEKVKSKVQVKSAVLPAPKEDK